MNRQRRQVLCWLEVRNKFGISRDEVGLVALVRIYLVMRVSGRATLRQ
jgi:hypothetical protein